MKKIVLLLLPLWLMAFGPVVKYAYNDEELTDRAKQTAEILKTEGVHLGLVENSAMFAKEGGLAALKMGYIELFAANAVELQYVVPSVWPKLEAAKNGDDSALRNELSDMGFELVKICFLPKKTLVILGNASALGRLNAAQRQKLKEGL